MSDVKFLIPRVEVCATCHGGGKLYFTSMASEHPCSACLGKGEKVTWVTLQDALRELGANTLFHNEEG